MRASFIYLGLFAGEYWRLNAELDALKWCAGEDATPTPSHGTYIMLYMQIPRYCINLQSDSQCLSRAKRLICLLPAWLRWCHYCLVWSVFFCLFFCSVWHEGPRWMHAI